MGKFCEMCNKGVMSGNKVSHSNRKTRRSWAPNIQRAHIWVNGSLKRVDICTRCLRSVKASRV